MICARCRQNELRCTEAAQSKEKANEIKSKRIDEINSFAKQNYGKFVEQEGMREFQRYEHGETEIVNRVLLIGSLDS